MHVFFEMWLYCGTLSFAAFLIEFSAYLVDQMLRKFEWNIMVLHNIHTLNLKSVIIRVSVLEETCSIRTKAVYFNHPIRIISRRTTKYYIKIYVKQYMLYKSWQMKNGVQWFALTATVLEASARRLVYYRSIIEIGSLRRLILLLFSATFTMLPM